jgi:uncharacterized protein
MESPVILSQTDLETRSLITRVYGWMTLGLAVTGWIAAMIGTREAFVSYLLTNRVLFYGLIIGEFALVIGLTAGINRMTPVAATMAFLTFAVFNGVTMSVIFVAYTASSIASTFFITASTFGIMSFYGAVTKRDLSTIGHICFMALIGLIIASVVNIFLRNPAIYWITSYAGILIFVGLTAYDTQKIKRLSEQGGWDSEEGKKVAIMGALTLYLDFINLFLMLMRVLGRRR